LRDPCVYPGPWVVAVAKYRNECEAAVFERMVYEIVFNVEVSGIEEGDAAWVVGFLGQLFEC